MYVDVGVVSRVRYDGIVPKEEELQSIYEYLGSTETCSATSKIPLASSGYIVYPYE